MSLNLDKIKLSIEKAEAELEALASLGADAKKGSKYKHEKEFRKHMQDIKVEAQRLRVASK